MEETDVSCRRGGAAGNKLKMTLGLPVYVILPPKKEFENGTKSWL